MGAAINIEEVSKELLRRSQSWAQLLHGLQLVPGSGRKQWWCPLEACVLRPASEVLPFLAGSQRWKHQGVDCHGSTGAVVLKIAAGIWTGKAISL